MYVHKYCQQITMLSKYIHTTQYYVVIADFLAAELILQLGEYLAQVQLAWRQSESFWPSLVSPRLLLVQLD